MEARAQMSNQTQFSLAKPFISPGRNGAWGGERREGVQKMKRLLLGQSFKRKNLMLNSSIEISISFMAWLRCVLEIKPDTWTKFVSEMIQFYVFPASLISTLVLHKKTPNIQSTCLASGVKNNRSWTIRSPDSITFAIRVALIIVILFILLLLSSFFLLFGWMFVKQIEKDHIWRWINSTHTEKKDFEFCAHL